MHTTLLVFSCGLFLCQASGDEKLAINVQVLLDWNPPAQPPYELVELEKRCSHALEGRLPDNVRGQILYRRYCVRSTLALAEESKKDLSEAAKLIPNDLDCRVETARTLVWEGKSEAARKIAAELMTQFPKLHHGYEVVGECELVAKNYTSALANSDAALSRSPSEIDSRIRRAAVLILLRRGDLAMKDVELLLSIPIIETYEKSLNEMRGEIMFGWGWYEATAASFERARILGERYRLGKDPPLTERNFRHLSICYSHCRKHSLAILTADRFSNSYPQSGEGVSLRGLSEAELGDLDSALANCRKGLEREPEISETHSAVGRVHLARGEWKEALSELEVAAHGQGEYGADASVRIAFIRSVSPLARQRSSGLALAALEEAAARKKLAPIAKLVEACAQAEGGDYTEATRLVDEYATGQITETDKEMTTVLRRTFVARQPYRVDGNAVKLSLPISTLLIIRERGKPR